MALSTAHESDPGNESDESDFSASAVVRHDSGSADVRLVGDLCPDTVWRLVTLLDGLVTDGITVIEVDVSLLRICTSHGLDALDATRRRLASVGGALSIHNADGVVRKVFDIGGMPMQDASR